MDDDFGSQPLSIGTPGASTLDYSDYELLKQALMNEKAAPELLPFEGDLVERVGQQLEHTVSTAPLMGKITRPYYVQCYD